MMRTISLLLCCILLPAYAFGVGTQAGTNILVTRAEIYHDNRVDYSNELSVVVSQYRGLDLVSAEVDNSVSPGGSAYFPYALTNIGNGSDTYHFELSGTTDKWSSTLIKDDNLNQLHEPNETTPVENDLNLAEDASYAFFVVLTAPTNAVSGETGTTRITVSGSVDDGSGYVGANGLTYGGPDLSASSSTAKVAHSPDITPPMILDIRIDGRTRFPNDIISKSPKLTARIIDDLPLNIRTVEIYLDTISVAVPTFYHWKRSYAESTGSFEATIDPLLQVGTYQIRLIAWDKSGNKAQETVGPFLVREDAQMVGKPINYPNPFRPLKGEGTKISYTLSKDMEITIYIYNIRGSLLWKRSYQPFEEGGKAGYNEIDWSGRSDFKQVLGNGIYILKIVNDNKVIGSGKIAILDTK